jgi:adenylylsulfate kinase
MIIWIIGMSASGKTAVGQELYKLLKQEHKNTVHVDGDVFRGLHGNDADHTVPGRKKNSDRMTRMCHFLDQHDIHVVCSFLSIFPEAQQWARDNYKNYFEVFLDVKFDTLVQRDPKGLYKKALSGEMPNMVGVDIEFPKPNSHLVIKNDGMETPLQIAQNIFSQIKENL